MRGDAVLVGVASRNGPAHLTRGAAGLQRPIRRAAQKPRMKPITRKVIFAVNADMVRASFP